MVVLLFCWVETRRQKDGKLGNLRAVLVVAYCWVAVGGGVAIGLWIVEEMSTIWNMSAVLLKTLKIFIPFFYAVVLLEVVAAILVVIEIGVEDWVEMKDKKRRSKEILEELRINMN